MTDSISCPTNKQFPNFTSNDKPTEKNKLFKTAKLTHRNFNPF